MKFENTCRSCLQDHSELLSIFDYYEEDVNLCNIIKDISNVEVSFIIMMIFVWAKPVIE